jgi:hypothetical protein
MTTGGKRAVGVKDSKRSPEKFKMKQWHLDFPPKNKKEKKGKI